MRSWPTWEEVAVTMSKVCKICGLPVTWVEGAKSYFHSITPDYAELGTIAREVTDDPNQEIQPL
jgi:hypothetical protein